MHEIPLTADLSLFWKATETQLELYLQRGMLPAGLYSTLPLQEIEGKMLRLDLTAKWETREPTPLLFVLTYKDGTLHRISDEGKPTHD